MRISPASLGFLLLLSGIAALPPVSIDMCLPALTAIGRDLSATPAQTGQTLSLFMIGFALSQLAFGPFADRHGRRLSLLIGCTLLAAAACGAAAATSIAALLGWRVVQGVGAGAGSVMAFAVVRDLFEGSAARAKLSYINAVTMVAPMVGPTIGSLVLTAAGWRPLFALQAAVGLVLLVTIAAGFAESLPRGQVRGLSPRALLAGYIGVLRHRRALAYCLVSALCFGALFAYVSGSPFVFIPLLGPRLFGLSFAGTALGLMLGALLSGRLAGSGLGTARILPAALAAVVVLHGVLLALAWSGGFNAASGMPPLILGNVAIGLIMPNAVHGAMEPFPGMAGVASALRGFLQMLAGGVASALVAVLYRGTPVAMTLVMAACSAGAFLVWASMLRHAGRAAQPSPGLAAPGVGS